MITYKLGDVEMKFAEIIWTNEPLTSKELTILAQEELNWNRSTTYTILRKLSEKGILKNDNAIVTSLVSKEEYTAMQTEKFVEEQFHGSLPKFFAAFARRKKLSDKEVMEIEEIINRNQEG